MGQLYKDLNSNKILVLGPPRSGTTIGSYIIHKSEKLDLIPEDFGVRMGRPELVNLFTNYEGFVIHANNGLFHLEALLKIPGVLVVLIARDGQECLRSAKKIGKLVEFNRAYQRFGKGN